MTNKDDTEQVRRLVDRFEWLMRSCPERQFVSVTIHPETWVVLARTARTDEYNLYMGYGGYGKAEHGLELRGVKIARDLNVEPLTMMVTDSRGETTMLSVGYGM